MNQRLKRYPIKDRTFALCMKEMRQIVTKREGSYWIRVVINIHVPKHLQAACITQCKLEGLL